MQSVCRPEVAFIPYFIKTNGCRHAHELRRVKLQPPKRQIPERYLALLFPGAVIGVWSIGSGPSSLRMAGNHGGIDKDIQG